MGSPLLLIVDDVESVRVYLRVLLARDGFDTVEAKDGVEALDLVRKLGPALSLVISDVQMPRMDGLALVDAIHADFPSLPVILVTGYSDVLPTGVPILHKPFSRETLLNAVAGAILNRLVPTARSASVQLA
jgi:two-component system cell cycle sensor histidine kinase/response regulator CckA